MPDRYFISAAVIVVAAVVVAAVVVVVFAIGVPDVRHLAPVGVVESDALDGVVGPREAAGADRRLETRKHFDVRLLQLGLIRQARFLHLRHVGDMWWGWRVRGGGRWQRE